MTGNINHSSDKDEIRCLMASYNLAGDRGRIDDLAACFAPDGILVTGLWTSRGADEIRRNLAEKPSSGSRRPLFARHHLTTSRIILTGMSSAEGRSYFFVMTEAGMDHAGVYNDVFVRQEAGWRIARREVWIDWKSPNSVYERLGVTKAAC